MHRDYLGDSYDLVKRFFAQVLDPIAPLHAHPKFIPVSIRNSYTAITTIKVFDKVPERQRFGILLDPDTGIPFPAEGRNEATICHAPLQFMTSFAKDFLPEYMICFDQSYHRKHQLSREAQRDAKREFLRSHGLSSFYYVSHAPFLFASNAPGTLRSILDRLMSAGVPSCRFQPFEVGSGGKGSNNQGDYSRLES